MSEFFSVLLGVFTFFDEVAAFLRLLRGMSPESRKTIHMAVEKALETRGDTSDIERILNGK